MYSKNCECASCRNTAAGGFEVMEFGLAQESMFSEAEEMELAYELLSVSSEEELDQFLGKIWKGIKKIAKPIGGALKGIAKKALPMVGGALGSFIPIPGVGTALGSALGGAVAKALEVEMEMAGLAQEDRDLEVARRIVRIAGTAGRLAARGDGSPQSARDALMQAVQCHAPHMAPVREHEDEDEAYGGRWRQRRAARIQPIDF